MTRRIPGGVGTNRREARLIPLGATSSTSPVSPRCQRYIRQRGVDRVAPRACRKTFRFDDGVRSCEVKGKNRDLRRHGTLLCTRPPSRYRSAAIHDSSPRFHSTAARRRRDVHLWTGQWAEWLRCGFTIRSLLDRLPIDLRVAVRHSKRRRTEEADVGLRIHGDRDDNTADALVRPNDVDVPDPE